MRGNSFLSLADKRPTNEESIVNLDSDLSSFSLLELYGTEIAQRRMLKPGAFQYGQLRQHLGEVFRGLAQHKDSWIEEGHLMADHVHMMISIPPKYAVSNVVGYIKGKSAIHLARTYRERKRNFAGQSFWARGYCVSTVGRDEEVIRNYIRHQEQEDERLEQLGLWR